MGSPTSKAMHLPTGHNPIPSGGPAGPAAPGPCTAAAVARAGLGVPQQGAQRPRHRHRPAHSAGVLHGREPQSRQPRCRREGTPRRSAAGPAPVFAAPTAQGSGKAAKRSGGCGVGWPPPGPRWPASCPSRACRTAKPHQARPDSCSPAAARGSLSGSAPQPAAAPPPPQLRRPQQRRPSPHLEQPGRPRTPGLVGTALDSQPWCSAVLGSRSYCPRRLLQRNRPRRGTRTPGGLSLCSSHDGLRALPLWHRAAGPALAPPGSASCTSHTLGWPHRPAQSPPTSARWPAPTPPPGAGPPSCSALAATGS